MGSELSYEDMGGSQGVEFSSRLLRTDKKGAAKIAVIESRPKAGESAYSKIVSWIPLDKYVVEKAEYYDKSGKLLKVADFANYKKFDNKTWRATKMQIRNVQNGRATIMALKGLSVNRGIDPDNFSVANLEELE
jgi:outer membrane lipoprotein-sorting protein